MRHIAGKLGLFIIMISLCTGCAMMSGPYGSIIPDENAHKDFSAFRLSPDMNYFYSGPDVFPNALIGIKKNYLLDNDLWKPLEPNPKLFKEMISNMQEKAFREGHLQHGFIIRDDQAKTIGVWYSILSIKTMIVKMGEGNKVVVYTPELYIYPRDNGGSGPSSR